MNDHTSVPSTSDNRIKNNPVRHEYRVLSDDEKAKMQAVKDKGLEFLDLIDSLRTPEEKVEGEDFALVTIDRHLNIAAERVEEAVMWAVKHITA